MQFKVGLCGAVVLTVLFGNAFYFKGSEVKFAKLRDAQVKLAELGYHCTSDSANGDLGSGFLVSRKPVPWSEVGMICKSGPMGKEWQGKVWVTFNPEYWSLEAVPDNAGVRVWGSIVAFGDEALLSEIESAL